MAIFSMASLLPLAMAQFVTTKTAFAAMSARESNQADTFVDVLTGVSQPRHGSQNMNLCSSNGVSEHGDLVDGLALALGDAPVGHTKDVLGSNVFERATSQLVAPAMPTKLMMYPPKSVKQDTAVNRRTSAHQTV